MQTFIFGQPESTGESTELRVAEPTNSLVQNRKSSLCAAIERSRLGDCPLWRGNACERSWLLYPPIRNCDRSYRC
jgi:hypothetical protein